MCCVAAGSLAREAGTSRGVGRARGGWTSPRREREGGRRAEGGHDAGAHTYGPSSLFLFPSSLSFLILFLSPLLPPYPSSPSFSFLSILALLSSLLFSFLSFFLPSFPDAHSERERGQRETGRQRQVDKNRQRERKCRDRRCVDRDTE